MAPVPAPRGETDPVAVGGDAERYLTFTLQGETYALHILDVTEIIEYRPLTVVPMMPTHIRGVLNLRGRVLPVVDLATRFDQPATVVARRTGIVVVRPRPQADGTLAPVDPAVEDSLGHGIGIVVDAVNEVVHLTTAEIEPAPAFGTGVRAGFIAGMARLGDGFVVVLDPRAVLAVDPEVLGGLVAQGATA